MPQYHKAHGMFLLASNTSFLLPSSIPPKNVFQFKHHILFSLEKKYESAALASNDIYKWKSWIEMFQLKTTMGLGSLETLETPN